MSICEFCGQEFKNGYSLGGHKTRCKSNPKYDEMKKSREQARLSAINKKLGEKKKFTVTCHKCGDDFEVEERKKQFPKKENTFLIFTCRMMTCLLR